MQVEQILKYYIEEDEELADRFRELKLSIDGTSKITNVVHQNEKYHKELAKAYRKIDRMRAKISDPFFRLREKNTNEYMLGKPAAKKPPLVVVTVDQDISHLNELKIGTCFAPPVNHEEILSGYQNERIRKQALKKKYLAEMARQAGPL